MTTDRRKSYSGGITEGQKIASTMQPPPHGLPALAILRSTVMSCLTVQQDKRKSQHFVAGNKAPNEAVKWENRPPKCRFGVIRNLDIEESAEPVRCPRSLGPKRQFHVTLVTLKKVETVLGRRFGLAE
jgi:hypothetical protein